MDLSFLTLNTIELFLLMLIRVTGMVVAAPFFSQSGVPVQVQVAVAVTMSLVLFPVYSAKAALPATDLWAFSLVAGQEFALGLLIGFVANLIFSAVQMAGFHITTQMGLGLANVIDPMTNALAPVLGQFYFLLGIVLFMNLNVHHSLIVAVARSFEAVPLASGFGQMNVLAGRFTEMGGELFALSILLVLPAMGMMLVLEIGLAFVAKLMPQMNVFMVALPLKIMVGLVLVYVTLPFTQETLIHAYQGLVKQTLVLYRS